MKRISLCFLFIILSACGANINVHKPIPNELITNSENGGYATIDVRTSDTEASGHFIGAVNKNLKQYLAELALYPKINSPLKVRIEITGYHIKTGASRGLMGSLAGADEVKSIVQVIDTETNKIIGESTVLTSTSMAHGQKAMAWVHADDIANFLSGSN